MKMMCNMSASKLVGTPVLSMQYDTLICCNKNVAFGSRSRLAQSLTPNLLLTRSPEKVDPRYIGTVMARWPEATVSYSGKGSGLGPKQPNSAQAHFKVDSDPQKACPKVYCPGLTVPQIC